MNGWNDTNVLPEFRQDNISTGFNRAENVLVRTLNDNTFIGHFHFHVDGIIEFTKDNGYTIPLQNIKAWHKIPKFS